MFLFTNHLARALFRASGNYRSARGKAADSSNNDYSYDYPCLPLLRPCCAGRGTPVQKLGGSAKMGQAIRVFRDHQDHRAFRECPNQERRGARRGMVQVPLVLQRVLARWPAPASTLLIAVITSVVLLLLLLYIAPQYFPLRFD